MARVECPTRIDVLACSVCGMRTQEGTLRGPEFPQALHMSRHNGEGEGGPVPIPGCHCIDAEDETKGEEVNHG